jgi:hypothetical protein
MARRARTTSLDEMRRWIEVIAVTDPIDAAERDPLDIELGVENLMRVAAQYDDEEADARAARFAATVGRTFDEAQGIVLGKGRLRQRAAANARLGDDAADGHRTGAGVHEAGHVPGHVRLVAVREDGQDRRRRAELPGEALGESYVDLAVLSGSHAHEQVRRQRSRLGDEQEVMAKAQQALELAGIERVFYPADGRIDRDTLIVMSFSVREPVAVRYAWTNAPEANLYNGAGLPAVPFRSDDW